MDRHKASYRSAIAAQSFISRIMPIHRGTLTGLKRKSLSFFLCIFFLNIGILSEALGVLFTNKD